MDGVRRKDFGVEYNKDKLPIGSVTFLDVGGSSQGDVIVGPLKCGEKPFGRTALVTHIFLLKMSYLSQVLLNCLTNLYNLLD